VSKKELLDISVLYVEDESIIRLEVTELLKNRVKTVYSASNGKEALEIFKKYKPDLVITDIRMPEMDGLELSKEIRKIKSDEVIIITTAYSDVEYLLKSLEIGINQYIVKPIEYKRLYDSLDKLYEVKVLNKKLEQTRSLLIEYKNAIDLSSVVFKTDMDGIVTYANEEFCKIMNASQDVIIGKDIKDLVYPVCKVKPKQNTFDFENARKVIEEKGLWRDTVLFGDNSEEYHYLKLMGLPIQAPDSHDVIQFIFLGQDVTDLFKKEEELIRQIYTDKLTNLPNRTSLLSDLEKGKHSLAILNIDSFREINDFYGPIVGDSILKEIGNRLKAFEKEKKYKVYKLSGDEFAVLFIYPYSKEKILKIVEFIRDLVTEKPFVYKDNSIYITATIGISSLESDLMEKGYSFPGQSLLIKADMALKKAKGLQKTMVYYDDSYRIFEEYEKNIFWATKLREAIKSDRIVPFYQPVVNNKTEKIEGYESLIRLIDNDNKVISPAYFLDISKRSRVYPFLTKKVVEKSFRDFKNLPYEVSINLSIEDILNSDTESFIIKKISSSPEVNCRLTFEIVESEGIEKYEDVSAFIKKIKEFGVKVAIDDFGSGYSNLERIMRLNIDYIKIDASIIKNLVSEKNAGTLARFIVEFAKALSIKTIAEFVCSKEIYERVVELGIDYSQGYYFSEPKPIGEILKK